MSEGYGGKVTYCAKLLIVLIIGLFAMTPLASGQIYPAISLGANPAPDIQARYRQYIGTAGAWEGSVSADTTLFPCQSTNAGVVWGSVHANVENHWLNLLLGAEPSDGCNTWFIQTEAPVDGTDDYRIAIIPWDSDNAFLGLTNDNPLGACCTSSFIVDDTVVRAEATGAEDGGAGFMLETYDDSAYASWTPTTTVSFDVYVSGIKPTSDLSGSYGYAANADTGNLWYCPGHIFEPEDGNRPSSCLEI